MTPPETDTDYAFWKPAGESVTVTYSLQQFHEIDFEVNEGYRRIPHGGIEVGGLLFGHHEPGQVRIEAYRLIQCEHATGPSFVLSERDLAELQKQMDASASDPELAGLRVVGWFVAHTRSPLRLNDRELAIFDRYFPGPNQVMVLVKPERFQPTRFAFFVRKPDGSIEREGTNTAIILPLGSRASRKTNGPLASIPAPAAAPPIEPPAPAPAPILPPPTEPPAPLLPPPPPRREVAAETDTGPVTSLTTIPKQEKLPDIGEIRHRGVAERAVDEAKAYQMRLVLVLILAAVLGCAAGYWAYRQLPSAIVPLSVRADASGLLVTWPVGQTRQAGYAAIRINDGVQQPLSPEEKITGSARISPPSLSNVKVELIVQHRMRDSRGIVRYLNPAAAPLAQSR